MALAPLNKLPVTDESDIVKVRQAVREATLEIKCSLVDQTKVVTAASELARNTLQHGGGGRVQLDTFETGAKKGVRLVFEDEGPGIPDVERALQDGFTTGGGLGLGLSGARRLSNEFKIESTLGKGTRVTIARWK